MPPKTKKEEAKQVTPESSEPRKSVGRPRKTDKSVDRPKSVDKGKKQADKSVDKSVDAKKN